MRAYRSLLVFLLCSFARVAGAQLTVRDTAALVDVVAEQIHAQFGTGARREPFALLPRKALASEDVGFTVRVVEAIHARDSSLIVAVPTRSTKRMYLGAPEPPVADSVKVPLSRSECRGTPPIHIYNDESLAFRRIADHWKYIERYFGSGGANPGCPW
jgi:hypothetical protein